MSRYLELAKTYKEKFGFNVLPLRGKKPSVNWSTWQDKIQSVEDIEKLPWNNSTGLGVVMGIGDVRCLDFDKVEENEIVELFLRELGIPGKYPWIVQSGSGEGYHIYIRYLTPNPHHAYTKVSTDAEASSFAEASEDRSEDKSAGRPNPLLLQAGQAPGEGVNPGSNKLKEQKENLLDKIGGEKAVYKFGIRDEKYCKHVELRWKDCQTALPNSMHESGGIYNFCNEEPKDAPVYIELEKVIDCLEKYCVIDPSPSREEPGLRRTGKVFYDKARLESALEFLSENLPSGSYEEWYKVGFALVPLEKEGEKYFVDMSLKNPNYKDSEFELRKKFDSLVKDYDGRISLGTIYHIAELYGWKKPIIKFWYKDDNGSVKISRARFKKFLEGEGFCKILIEHKYLFVHIADNIVDEIEVVNVKEFVMNYVKLIPAEDLDGVSRTEIIDTLIKSANQVFTMQFLEFLITRELEFNRDEKDSSFLYYKNGYVEVTRLRQGYSGQGKTFYNYKKLNKCIWRNRIIQRDFGTVEDRSAFEDFLYNVCKCDNKRFEALKSCIGYLLHQYKDPANTKAVALIDEKLSEGAFGRSGKGLVIKAIAHVRNLIIEDGRNFNPGKNFAFQRVKADTDILAFEDVRDKFPFDRLFSVITEGITIERKNRDEIFIPYKDSPKVVLSTNYSIRGIDDSSVDRQFIVEFSDYYNIRHRPIDDFGKLFFEGWTQKEWLSFDNLMIECLQLFLMKGLVCYEYVNLERKKLIDETSAEFAEFSDEFESGKEYDKKILWEDFKKDYDDFDLIGAGKLTQGKFTRWLKKYGRIKGLNVVESKSGAKRTLEFVSLTPTLSPRKGLDVRTEITGNFKCG